MEIIILFMHRWNLALNHLLMGQEGSLQTWRRQEPLRPHLRGRHEVLKVDAGLHRRPPRGCRTD